MHMSRLDKIYRTVRLQRYFIKGWGDPKILKRLCEFRKVVSNRDISYNFVSPDHPVTLGKEVHYTDYYTVDGYFQTPVLDLLPGVVPKESEKVHFQFVLPKKWQFEDYKPICIHMAGTGDQYYWRRRHLIAKPLIKEAGIGAIIIENPFYGLRKPKEQLRTILHNVSDIFVMGSCLIFESLVLLHLCERLGYGPLGITGISMGGHMASIAATCWPKPLVVVPCLSSLTASGVFTQGALSGAINWNKLGRQFQSNNYYNQDIKNIVHIIDDDAFRAGQQFAKDMSRKNDFELSGSSVQLGSKSNTNFQRELHSLDNNFRSVESSIVHKELDSVKECYPNGELSQNDMSRHDVSKLDLYLNTSDVGSSKFNILRKQTDDSDTAKVEAINFMHGIMDECTHLRNYSVPFDTSLAIAVCARDDAYVPVTGSADLRDVWPGSEVRFVDGGHVNAFFCHQKDFRCAIIDAFTKWKEKYGCKMLPKQ